MKKLSFLPFLLLLTGCVSYYYPQTAIEDGVYYAEDDPAYINNAYSYSGVAYYPWWSMDYFYLGYGPYIGSGFSLGLSYGYSPWYYPYYGFYSPWYRPYYPYRHHAYHHGRQNRNQYGGRDQDRHAGNDRADRRDRDRQAGNDQDDRRNRNRDREVEIETPDNLGSRGNRDAEQSASPVRVYVSTPPSGYSGNQGMVVRSREQRKPGDPHLNPIDTRPVQATKSSATTEPSTVYEYRSRRGNSEVRYRSGSKSGRPGIGPVDTGGGVKPTTSTPSAGIIRHVSVSTPPSGQTAVTSGQPSATPPAAAENSAGQSNRLATKVSPSRSWSKTTASGNGTSRTTSSSSSSSRSNWGDSRGSSSKRKNRQ